MDTFQEINLKGEGAACPSVPQDELVRKITVLAAHAAFVGTQRRKKDQHLRKCLRLLLGYAERKLER